MPRIVLHDYFEALEGGGKLCAILAEALDADLGAGFVRPAHPFTRDAAARGRLYSLNAYSRLPLWRQFKLSLAFQRRTAFPADYDTVLYSGFYSPLAALQRSGGRHILYCHTPPRFVYDQRDFYQNSLPAPLRPLLARFTAYLQPRYEEAARRMDLIIANSRNVQTRLRDYLGLDSIVIHPPCAVEDFRWLGQEDYYLSSARLDPLKRVDTIVRTFLQMPQKRLVVASGGPELEALKRLAGRAPNIRFTGWLEQKELTRLVGNAIATLYVPRAEDFGMSPLESMAAGKPVIGVAEGGLLESILPQRTGLLLHEDFTPADIRAAVEHLTPERAASMRRDCEIRAQQFRSEIFIAKMREIL